MPLALATDLYELTMMAGYFRSGLLGSASFELSVRSLPRHRSFLIAAGLEQALEYLEQLRFTDDEISWLRSLPELRGAPADFFEYLARFRFTGDVWAIPEGTPVFPPEPLLRVDAPLPEAQLVETALLSIVAFQTAVATRAARMTAAAAGRPVVEFGARRAHGIEAGVHAARAAVIGGCVATSDVEAARRFGLKPSGTMAHAWVLAFEDEVAAFRAFADTFGPDHAVLLLDTYDTIAAARRVVASGLRPAAVRLDSGDLVALSREVRRILDAGGLHATRIFASGDLDEWRIAEIVASGAPVDAFGVGAALSTASDTPALGGIYKLVAIERGGRRVPVMKHSPHKATLPGCKQVWRTFDGDTAAGDIVELADAGAPPAPADSPNVRRAPLLERVMAGGRRLRGPEPVGRIQQRCREQLSQLPSALRALDAPATYPVDIGRRLAELVGQLEQAESARTAR